MSIGPKRLLDLGRGLVDAHPVGDVGLDRDRPAAGFFDFARRGLEALSPARDQRDVRAVTGEPPNQSPTQPRRRAGDDDDLWLRHGIPVRNEP